MFSRARHAIWRHTFLVTLLFQRHTFYKYMYTASTYELPIGWHQVNPGEMRAGG